MLTLATNLTSTEIGQENGFFRFPDIRGDLIVFTSEGDLWSVLLTGNGEAHRLTRHNGQETYARISPDGKWIAFTGEYDGNRDVYVMPTTGGAPERLTFHPGWDEVVGWTPDSKQIMFRSPRNSPNFTWKIYTVGLEGGFPEDFGLDKGTRISLESKGSRLAFTRLRREASSWKRYQGGQAMDIWAGNLKSLDFKKITDYTGTDAFPMWINDRIYFLSDRSGRANLFSMKPDGSDVKQHTYEEKWDVRWPSSDGKNIVYQKAMDIWTFDISSGKSLKIDIILPTDRIRVRERIINPSGYIDSYSLPNEGRRIAVAARGEVFTFPVEKAGYIRQLTHTPDARDRIAVFSPDGKQIAVISDATGEDEIWLYPSDGKGKSRQLTKNGDMRRYWLSWSPDGTMLVFSDKANRLWIVNVETGKQKLIDEGAELWKYVWSPDSKWIAWIKIDEDYTSDIHLYNIDTKEKTRISTPMTNENDVAWDPDGKYLYFKSDSWFNPMLGNGSYISDKSDKFYVILLAEDCENPFEPKLVEAYGEDEEDDDKEKEDEDKDDKEDDEKDENKEEDEGVEVEITLDGLQDRIYLMPIKAGNFFGLTATSGRLYYGSWQRSGMWIDGEWQEGFPLHTFDIEEEEAKVVGGGRINGYGFSPDRKKMFVRRKGAFIVMDAGSTDIPEENGHVDMSGWSMEIDPKAEWAQILREVWRLQRDYFYDPDMHGVDWKKVWKQYSVLLPRISNRDELNDLIREMLGELNIGHAYIFGGDIKHGQYMGTGGLGCDLEPTKSGAYRINKILRGDGWGDEPVSPLAATLANVKVGDYIVAIDDVPLKPSDNIYKRLVNKSGKEILLSLNSKPVFEDAREIPVKTIDDEGSLRYFDWVRDRREYVDSLSDGKIGYIHIPDMGGWGLSMWMRLYYQQIRKKALLIDVRYNRGGFVADMILSVLNQKVWARGIAREGIEFNRPWTAFNGPKATVCNHETASDGETFSEAFKRLKLGKLFGTRTWGGWVGIHGGHRLLDRGRNTVPQSSGWGIDDGKWLIEGPGVTPDVEIDDEPAKMLRGEDPQLEAAVKHLLQEIEKWPQPPEMPVYPRKPLRIRHLR